MPNDDLVLNSARRQKNFASPAAKKIAQLRSQNSDNTNNSQTGSANNKSTGNGSKTGLQRTASLGNLGDKGESVVRVRSLVEVEDYDGKYSKNEIFFLKNI